MSEQIINLLITGTLDTLQMTIISTVMAMLLGIPLGVVLVVTSKGHILENVALNKVLGAIVNATRSVPFIILMVAIIPFTRMVVGTSIGTTAACVPLTIAAIPFLARLVETSIKISTLVLLRRLNPWVQARSKSFGKYYYQKHCLRLLTM